MGDAYSSITKNHSIFITTSGFETIFEKLRSQLLCKNTIKKKCEKRHICYDLFITIFKFNGDRKADQFSNFLTFISKSVVFQFFNKGRKPGITYFWIAKKRLRNRVSNHSILGKKAK